MAQAQHGSAPDIAGQNKANPTSLILSTAMLLDWLALRNDSPQLAQAARAIEAAIEVSLHNRVTRSADLGGPLGTVAFTDQVVTALAAPE